MVEAESEHPSASGPPVTLWLQAAAEGDREAANRVFEAVYQQLRVMAKSVFGSDRGTLQPTLLIHEAWFKLVGHEGSFRDRQHFLGVACRAMRQVVADHYRSRGRVKRGGGAQRLTLSDVHSDRNAQPVDLAALDEALTELDRLNKRHAQVVTLRVFGGLTIQETAELLGVSHGTVESDWAMGRAFLRRHLTSA